MVFWKSGRFEEVVSYKRWLHIAVGLHYFNPIDTGIFWSSGTGGRGGGVGGVFFRSIKVSCRDDVI